MITLEPPGEIDARALRAYDWAVMEPEEKRGKFFLAQVADERLLLEMRELVKQGMQEGISEQEFIHRAVPMLAELDGPQGRKYYDPAFWRDLTPEQARRKDNDVRQLDSMARLRLIYRTQSEMAAGFRQYQEDIEMADAYPAWRFYRQAGAKTKRADHVAHEGDVRLISDIPFWLARNDPDFGGFNQPYPPFGFNSWMRVEPVSRKECEKLGLLQKGEKVPAVPARIKKKYGLAAVIRKANAAGLDGLDEEARLALDAALSRVGIELESVDDAKQAAADAKQVMTVKPEFDPETEAAELAEAFSLFNLFTAFAKSNKKKSKKDNSHAPDNK